MILIPDRGKQVPVVACGCLWWWTRGGVERHQEVECSSYHTNHPNQRYVVLNSHVDSFKQNLTMCNTIYCCNHSDIDTWICSKCQYIIYKMDLITEVLKL